ncbi:hypothetical protein OY671_009881, partial [Metschnikowia pulcherrima]
AASPATPAKTAPAKPATPPATPPAAPDAAIEPGNLGPMSE